MKNRRICFLILTFFFSISLFAQQNSLFVFREVQNAIRKQTRSLDGKPGPVYWQNKVSYVINVNFDPEAGKIEGKELVKYKNNSPNTLYDLLINLYPNLFKKGNARDRKVEIDDLHSGVIIKKISINNTEIEPYGSACNYDGTTLSISLPVPLWPDKELELVIEWECTLEAKSQIRISKYGENTWFVGYWYPQIAVYDDVFGWDEIDYDGLHEFYSAYADFDVKITLPAKQIVWATGIWQNPAELLNEKYLKRYQKALESENVVHIIHSKDLDEQITTQATANTWHFTAENVTDFSFATSDHYLWDGLSLVVDKENNRKTFIQTAYDKQSLDFYDVAEISKKTVSYLSDSMPGVPFPYPRMTVFNGGGGMEFPMMVNDRSCLGKSATVNLTSHEIAHTYFPFYVGINQERFSWMDEGWAQFLPAEFQEQQVGYNNQAAQSANVYSYYAGTGLEMPMMVPSHFIKGYEYYVGSYYRPELAYRALQDLLGRELFLKSLQEYIHRWNGTYPTPYDFFFTFNDVANEDLGWFWKPWFFEMAYPDLAINEIKNYYEDWEISIENIGGLPVALVLTINYSDGSSEQIIKSARVWKLGNAEVLIKHRTEKQISEIILGNDRIPDTDKRNNRKSGNPNP